MVRYHQSEQLSFQFSMKNDVIVASFLVCIAMLTGMVSVFLGILGIKSFVSLVTYILEILIIIKLRGHYASISRDIWFVLIFLFYFLFSFTYSISHVASVSKFDSIIFVILIQIGFIVVAFRHNFDILEVEARFLSLTRKYASPILLLFVILMLLGFTEKGDDFEGRDTIVGMGNAIWCSRFVGILAMAIVIYSFRYGSLKIKDIVGLLCAIYIMVRCGSRGPILAAVVVILFMLFPRMKNWQRILTVSMLFLLYFLFLHFTTRYLAEDNVFDSNGRFEILEFVFNEKFDIQSTLIGYGIGGYQLAMFGEDFLHYPHNIFVETFVETGLVGLFLLLLLLIVLYKRRCSDNIFHMYCLYYFINSLFSGDITGNNYFFIFAVISLLSSARIKSSVRSIEIKSNKR